MKTQETGQAGEQLARSYLEKKGYRCLVENYKTVVGELDLVMRDGKTIVFVEVKSRVDDWFALPEEYVTYKKQQKIIKAALFYAKEEGLMKRPLRFDVVAVTPEEIRHHKGAFQATDTRYI